MISPQHISERMVESDSRIKAYKFVAYAAVTFSVVAVLSVVVTLPMVYNYVSHVRRQMQHELNFCKAKTNSFLFQIHLPHSIPGISQGHLR
jgi:ABC-type nitrate/sulfonate/bicarbonate transport system permease component